MERLDVFDELKNLLTRLNRGERDNLKSFLTAFDTHSMHGPNKSAEVVNHILSYPKTSSREVLITKFELPQDKYNLNKFFNRLKERVLESMMLSLNINRKGAYSDWYANKLDVRKKLMQAQTLMGKGMGNSATRIYADCLSKSEKLELYEELLESLRFIQHNTSLQQGLKVFYQLEEKIKDVQYKLDSVWQARSWYLRYHSEQNRKANRNDKIGLLTEALSDLQDRVKKTNSSNINYFLHFLLMEFYLTLEDHDAVRKTGLQLLDLTKNNPALYNQQRIANIYIDLADNELFRLNFKEAYSFLDQTMEMHSGGGFNKAVAKTLQMFCLFYLGKYHQFELELENETKSNLFEEAPFELYKLNYLRAAVSFIQKDFKNAFKVAENETDELREDSEGWNLGLRIFSILCCIELNWDDLANNKIEALRKHSVQLKKSGLLRKRDKNIIKVLIKLSEMGFNFKETFRKAQYNLDQLEKNDSEFRWEPRSHELIIFNQWFKAKMEGKAYKFNSPAAPAPDYEILEEKSLNTLRDAESVIF